MENWDEGHVLNYQLCQAPSTEQRAAQCCICKAMWGTGKRRKVYTQTLYSQNGNPIAAQLLGAVFHKKKKEATARIWCT
jgi:hypothetical protein